MWKCGARTSPTGSCCAGVLGADPTALFATGDDEELEPGRDDVVLESALASIARFAFRDELAEALGWDVDRVVAGLERLAARMQGTGQRLQKSPRADVRLIPAAGTLSDEQQQRLARSSCASAA